MNSEAIRVNNLERRFGKVIAVNGLEFSVPYGSVTGLLGPNGAGKSTTIFMLTGLLRRHGGEISVLGYDPETADVEIRKRTGFVPEDPRHEPRFTVQQNLAFLEAFRPGWNRKLEKSLLQRFDLDPSKPTRSLSRGQRAKLALIGALSFKPELLILDDPTSGLDPLARREFIEGIVSVLALEGRTVFFSSHQVDDIERVADRIVMISSGRCIYAETMENIHKQWRLFRLSFRESDAPEMIKVPGLFSWKPVGRSGRLVVNNYSQDTESALASIGAGYEAQPLSLEDIYIELVRSAEIGDKS